MADDAIEAIARLKSAGFLIIGLGKEALFHGFASKSSCSQFLTASSLDDILIPHRGETVGMAMIQAAAKWLLDLDRSFLLGGDETDRSEARITGCTPFTIEVAGQTSSESFRLSSAVDQIIQLSSEAEPALG